MNIKRASGFTLVEILIVLAIMGFLAALGIKNLKRDDSLKSIVRKMSTVLKATRSYSKLHGQTYRMVIDFSDKGGSAYWIESASGVHLLDPKVNDKYKLSMDKEKEEAASGFEKNREFLKKEVTLSGEWTISGVETSGHPDRLSEGTAYIYFFPQGVSEEATIQISNKKATWTLHLNPLMGIPDIFEEAKNLKDFKQ